LISITPSETHKMSQQLPFPILEANQRFAQPEQVASIRQALATAGACLLRHMPQEPDHHSLLTLAHTLGTPLHEARNLEGQAVALVAVDPHSELPAYANTPYAFALHTDCSDLPDPPDLVLLLCETQASTGGESTFLHLKTLLEALSEADKLALQAPIFAFRHETLPILTQHGQHFQIRYQRLHQELHRRLHERPAGELEALLDRVDNICQAKQTVFRLQPGDCWITHNQTSLHGRLAFAPESPRSLKRVRLRLQPALETEV